MGCLLLIGAQDGGHILLGGGLMAIGSAGFSAANWALTADLAPRSQTAQYFALANVGTAGAAASAGLLGPLIDWGNTLAPGGGYTALFALGSLAMAASPAPLFRIATTAPPRSLSG